MAEEYIGGVTEDRRATDFKSEEERLTDRYGSGMTRSLVATYGWMMGGIGLDLLKVPYALPVSGVLAALSFISLCYYSSKMNKLMRATKKD